MPITWFPDFCPDHPDTGLQQACILQLENDWSKCLGFGRMCTLHAQVQADNGLSDQELYEAILQSCRAKEAAREAAKKNLGLPKEHPGVPYRVEPDGSFRLGIQAETAEDGRKTWTRMAEWPTEKTTLEAEINDAVSKVADARGAIKTVTAD